MAVINIVASLGFLVVAAAHSTPLFCICALRLLMSSTPQLRLHLGHPAPGHASSSMVGQVELTTQSVAHGEKSSGLIGA